MKPINFQGATHGMKKPEDWDEEADGPCDTLPVMVQELPSGHTTFTSVWVPSDEERLKLVAGSALMLSIVGSVQPVVALAVTDQPSSEIEVQDPDAPKPSTLIMPNKKLILPT